MKKKIIILSGALMERSDLGRFVIDPETVTLHKDRLIADYNHIEEEVIGFVEDVRVEEGKLVGDLIIESVSENDRAAEVIKRVESGVPYEISPTVMLDETGVEAEVIKDENGDYFMYRNVPLRGVSVCPYATDKLTTILRLSGGLLTMKKVKKMKNRKLTKMAADEILDEALVETTVVDEAAPVDETAPVEEVVEEVVEYTAYPLLEEMIAAFGLAWGVEYYRRGYTMEEAEQADYAMLKAARLKARKLSAEEGIDEAGAIDDVSLIDNSTAEAAENAEIVSDAQEAVDEAADKEAVKTTLKANIVLARQVRALAKELTKLKSLSVRGTDALSTSQRKSIPMTATQKMARKIHNR